MMKKIMIYLVLMIISICNVTYAEEIKSYRKELESYGIMPIVGNLNDNDYVNRYDAITMICESVGFSSDTYAKMCKSRTYGIPFDDMQYTMDSPYFEFASQKNIVIGVENSDEQKPNNFEPFRNATYEEVVAFAVRCLPLPDDVKSTKEMNLSQSWEWAKESGILNGEEFDNNKKQDITYYDFCSIVYNLIQKPAYIDSYNEIELNSETTYLDIIKEIGVEKISFFRMAMIEMSQPKETTKPDTTYNSQ